MLTIEEIIKATGGKTLHGSYALPVSGISIDSRTIKDGELFVAIKGDVFDGHNFIDEAVKKGACGVIIREGHPVSDSMFQNGLIISVQDTLPALQEI
ncbi:MAG: Mur ligase domain-containing protein, partial [Nitrospirota bacterium]